MPTRVRSYSKINLGLAIGPVRPDRFHGLATLYQTLALHDWVTVEARRLSESATRSITLTTNRPGVPTDARNTAWKVVDLALERLGVAAEVHIHIEKELPVQGGMGAGSANAAAALLGLERELSQPGGAAAGSAVPALSAKDRLGLAAQVGSDVPLFLVGGAVQGTGRGEVVSAMRDFGPTPCVVALPAVGVSTPLAFRDWDARHGSATTPEGNQLTGNQETYRLNELSRVYSSLLGLPEPVEDAAHGTSGIIGGSTAQEWTQAGQIPRSSRTDEAGNSQAGDMTARERSTRGGLAENPHDLLLALVRTGIENDFEEVVFPQYPLLREIKRELMGVDSGAPATYAALSGSGSALFGLYRSQDDARAAQQRVQAFGCRALLTDTLPRREYWQTMFAE